MKVTSIIALFALTLSASADDGCDNYTNGGKCIQYRSVGTSRIPAKWVAAFNAANAELEKDWSQVEAAAKKE
ncbi:hypothetical protein GRF29_96g592455 [Pseudopithomyces chartarum]|uniref:Uncharacterized protein n=1 Tax=Pseudopithomyces chartarum TaxID=1892770 RepID=A0AAN6RF31_9PLEO|nr:hypothetical protein GRF29_96g592455 [Pseudopithomyces chartarum]